MDGELNVEKREAEDRIMKCNGKRIQIGVTQPCNNSCWGHCELVFKESVIDIKGYEICIHDKRNPDNKIAVMYKDLTDIKIDKARRLWLTYIYENVHITIIA